MDSNFKLKNTVEKNITNIMNLLCMEFYVTALSVLFTLLIIIFIYWILFTPSNRVRDLTDVGYGYLEDDAKRRGRKLKSLIKEMMTRRKLGELPPIYPNGWFALMESHDLKAGEAKPIDAIGQNFVIFRSEDGTACVLDAYCPHLGAHLGIGGIVHGNCVSCPFHGWEFDGRDGSCTAIPYADKVPQFAKVKKWQTVEANGFIFVWFHADEVEPTWYPIVINEINDGIWTFRGRTEHYINSHIQDIPENGGDLAHLPQVHSTSMLSGVDLRKMRTNLMNFSEHIWEGTWKECENPDRHMAVLTMTHAVKCLGRRVSFLSVNVTAKQIGPGIVHLELDTRFGKGTLVQTVTPVAPLTMKVVHRFYCDRQIPRPFSKLALFGEAVMFERDIMIWNNKTYISKPLLVKEDKLLAKHRRWFSQFYSENSPRFSFAKDTLEW